MQVGQGDAAPLDVQGVNENPAATGAGRDGYRVLQGGDAPVSHELDQRADTIRRRRLDQPGERVGQPGLVGILADGVDVPGAKLGRGLEDWQVIRGPVAEPDPFDAEHGYPGIGAAAHRLGQQGGAWPHRPGLLTIGDRADPQSNRGETGFSGDRHQIAG